MTLIEVTADSPDSEAHPDPLLGDTELHLGQSVGPMTNALTA